MDAARLSDLGLQLLPGAMGECRSHTTTSAGADRLRPAYGARATGSPSSVGLTGGMAARGSHVNALSATGRLPCGFKRMGQAGAGRRGGPAGHQGALGRWAGQGLRGHWALGR